MIGTRNYIGLVAFHIIIGVVIYAVPSLSTYYALAMLVGSLYFIVKSQNGANEVLLASAYVIGSEAFLRMTGGNILYEFSKYCIILFMCIGMYYRGFSKHAVAYWIFICLLVPGLVVATQTLNYDAEMRKTLSFNISGPLCLGIASLYTYSRKITLPGIATILLFVGLPIISTAVYLILYTPDLREVITGTGSNFETSGRFGPNQVSTILGLGMFIFFSRLIYGSPTKFLSLINLVLGLDIGYRGLITFSRGGMITAVLMLILLVFITYIKVRGPARMKMNYMLLFFIGVFVAAWTYSSVQTGGLIDKRYANQDAAGRVKESQFTGRENISATEIQYFLDNPIFGIGVAKGTELRNVVTGQTILSHNEVTRMLAEHGSFGILALLILLITPLVLYLDNKSNVYVLCFVTFWLLTINHAAMRLAAPAFIYALSLLKVVPNEEPAVHRQ